MEMLIGRGVKAVSLLRRAPSVTLSVLLIATSASGQPSAVSRAASARTPLPTVELARRISPSIVTITTPAGFGSGVIVAASGVIVTNLHVLRGATSASVKLANGDIYDDIGIIDVDARKDLLVLKIKAVDLAHIGVGNSDEVAVGDKVVAMGSPRGLDQTLSDGIISAIRDSGDGYRLFQTNAAASPGSSGGGLFNQYGELIGIVAAKLTSGENLNFGVPINYVRGLLSTQVRMTLQQLATLYPGDSGGMAGSERTSSEPKSSAKMAKLETLVQQTGYKYEKAGDSSWTIVFQGEHSARVPVHLSLSEDLTIIQCLITKSFSVTDTALATDLLRKNFANDLVKIALTNDGQLESLNETELRLLDSDGLKRILLAVATMADDVIGALNTAPAPETASALIGPPSSRDLKAVLLLKKHLGIRFDGSAWKVESIRDENEVYQFAHSSNAAYIKVIAEKAEIPLDKMFGIALANARKFDPAVKEVRRGWRLVNGTKLALLEFDATVNSVNVRYYAHYYSDDNGTVQILGWCMRDVIDSYRDKIDSFVSGFEIRKKE
jgi:hypothetical protein